MARHGTKTKKRRRVIECAIHRVWGYPATDDLKGKIDWAWVCACGGRGVSYPDRVAARDAADDHLAENAR